MAKSFLRIRPINNCSSKDPSSPFFKLDDVRIECRPPQHSQSFKNSKSSLRESKRKVFEFDKVLDEDTNQEQLYNDCVQPLLTEYFNGENVLLFAYGTTSSGKTFTMRGNSLNPGVVPRCISDIFQSVKRKLILLPMYKRARFNEHEQLNKFDFKKEADLKSTILNSVEDKSFCDLNKLKSRPDGFKSFLEDDENVRYIVWVSFFELYNESLVDLLSATPNANQRNGFNLKIVRDQQNNFFVTGLKHVYVNSAEEAMKVYLYGIDNLKKHISSTAMNSTSSRSHSVFTLSMLTLKKTTDDDYVCLHVNNFSLCDLAGQERSKKTLTSGIHLKEAGMINKSLLSLKRCIQMIKDRKNSSSQFHIPFNECMLTKVFQPYLTGNGLTFIIVNINPMSENYDETINSLEFSVTASQIEIIKNESTNSLRDKLKRITQLWLQSSKCWSTFQQASATAFLNSDLALFKHPSTSSNTTGKSLLTNKTQDDFIVDSEDILNNQQFDNTLDIEHSITQKVKEMEETMVEINLYDSKFVEDLNNRIDELEQQIQNKDLNNKPINLECIHNSVVEIYEKHEEEKRKIKDRMNSLMDERMKMLQEEYDTDLKEYEREIQELSSKLSLKEEEIEDLNMKLSCKEEESEDLNMKLSCKENEAEIYKKSLEQCKKELEEIRKEFEEKKKELEETKKELEKTSNEFEENKKELEETRKELEDSKKDSNLNSGHTFKLIAELDKIKAENSNLKLKDIEKDEKLIRFNEVILETESKNCLDNLITKLEYEERLNDLVQVNNNLNDRFNLISHQNDNQSTDPQRTNSTIRQPTSAHHLNQNEISLDQFSIIEFNKSITADLNQKRSSLKRPFNYDQPSLFTTNIQPIRTDFEPPFKQPFDKSGNHHLNLNNKTVDLPSILETSDYQLNSTNGNPNQLQNADQLLESIVKRNYENELEELRKKCKEYEEDKKSYEALVDIKDKEIKKLNYEKQKMKKEMSRKVDEGLSIRGSSAKITTSLYTSVLNHTLATNVNTPYKPLSQLQSARKKRMAEEDQPSSDARYLDLLKQSDKSPTTEKKTTKKKKTAVETKRKAKEEPKKEDKIVEEAFDKDEQMDDLVFFVEGGTEKKSKKSKPKKDITTSVRKKMPLDKCRESFIYQNDDDIKLASQQDDNKKTRQLRSRRKIAY